MASVWELVHFCFFFLPFLLFVTLLSIWYAILRLLKEARFWRMNRCFESTSVAKISFPSSERSIQNFWFGEERNGFSRRCPWNPFPGYVCVWFLLERKKWNQLSCDCSWIACLKGPGHLKEFLPVEMQLFWSMWMLDTGNWVTETRKESTCPQCPVAPETL